MGTNPFSAKSLNSSANSIKPSFTLGIKTPLVQSNPLSSSASLQFQKKVYEIHSGEEFVPPKSLFDLQQNQKFKKEGDDTLTFAKSEKPIFQFTSTLQSKDGEATRPTFLLKPTFSTTNVFKIPDWAAQK